MIPWISRLLDPRIHFKFFEFEAENERIIIFKISAASNTPVKYEGTPYIRIGSYKKKLDEFPEKAIRVIIYQGKNKLKTKKEQEGKKGYASGFKGLINYINDQLPMNEEIGKVFRKEVKIFPELAIRE